MAALASPQVIGRYAVYGKIASGGMASVCFGRMLGGEGFARTVAIKRLHPHLAEDPEFRATLIDEARMAARIHHPNVVPTLDVVTSDGELMLVMEYVRGESLARLLKTERAHGRSVPFGVASAVVCGALHGLHAAHEATSDNGQPLCIVHRDVSPQNLLVGVDGMARVIDFGVALAAGRLQTTREGALKGKIAYMAPEQIAGREVTRRADVYAMGVVLWETLTGERLFQGDNDVALVAKVIAGAEDPPSQYVPEVPPGLDELVMRALAADPSDRFATAQEMAARLARVVPPSLATDVGKWVETAARGTLRQRGAELAEIESSSGIGLIAPASSPSSRSLSSGGRSRPSSGRGLDPPGDESLGSQPSHPSRRSTSSLSRPSSAPVSQPSGQLLSQPSRSAISRPSSPSLSQSSSMGTPAPSTLTAPRSMRSVGLAAMGVGFLLAIGLVAVWRGAVDPAGVPPPATGRGPNATTPAAPATNASPDPASPPLPPPTGAPPSVAVTSLPPVAVPVTALPPAQTPPVAAPPSRSAPRATHPAAVAPPAAAPATKPKASCNPPYVIDSAGDRQYKPECL